MKRFISLASLLVFISCSTNPCSTDLDSLTGLWVYSGHSDEYTEYTKMKDFKADEPGFEFNTNGILIKRDFFGWCSTPPIEYANLSGTWMYNSETSIVTQHYETWQGKIEVDLLIISVASNKLKVNFLDYRVLD